MKELLEQFSRYHIWANNLISSTILQLPAEKHIQEVPSSFNSFYKTVLHQWDAESIWWQRIKLAEQIIVPSDIFNGTLIEAVGELHKQSVQWNGWLKSAREDQLRHEFIYRNSKKEQFRQPVYQVLHHIFNHGTYHRGQLVNMLRQLSFEKIPQTDFIVWCRKK